ncbi:hypothetical protein TNCT_595401 [Trichonephila clavata]|uniref:Uncharacterized protein n=1 Tax=Trichonephila clavata TaxID=2740835 RepID=A0A8X6GAV2_TRICU|nr:hypothetical protein TNCT_595401 [Trichonephila clavata]
MASMKSKFSTADEAIKPQTTVELPQCLTVGRRIFGSQEVLGAYSATAAPAKYAEFTFGNKYNLLPKTIRLQLMGFCKLQTLFLILKADERFLF